MKIIEIFKNGLLSYYSANDPASLIPVALLGALAIIICAYLLGSINSAIIISKFLYKDDIRNHGSGNAGATNMLRTYGRTAAVLTVVFDLLKAVVAVYLGMFLMASFPGGYLAGLFCVVGHVFPICYRFKGGKGVLCTAAMVAVLSPMTFLFCFAIFMLIVALTRFVSLGSVIGVTAYPLILARMYGNGGHVVFAILVALIVIYCHRDNMKRLIAGKESKISFKKKKSDSISLNEDKNGQNKEK